MGPFEIDPSPLAGKNAPCEHVWMEAGLAASTTLARWIFRSSASMPRWLSGNAADACPHWHDEMRKGICIRSK